MRLALRATFVSAAVLAILVACGQGAGSPSPSAPQGSTEPSAAASQPAASPATAADAAALVLASDPRFAGLEPFEPNAIGQCCFYRVAEVADGWLVMIEVGWGDCPAGCINRHTWTFGVSSGGEVHQVTEMGPAVPVGLLPVPTPPGSSGAPGESPPAGGDHLAGPGIEGVALAGPTCPVMQPGDSSCADRPVAGATIHVLAADGTEVATLTTDAAGRFAVLLDPGDYRLVAEPMPGIMHGPEPMAVTVGSSPVEVTISYDTGIR
jgi:hypothetical protein